MLEYEQAKFLTSQEFSSNYSCKRNNFDLGGGLQKSLSTGIRMNIEKFSQHTGILSVAKF